MLRSIRFVSLASLLFSAAVIFGLSTYAVAQQDNNSKPEEVAALKAASVNGKYSELLAVIKVPGDVNGYGDFNDWGHWTGTAWAGYTGLPQGYWVYVHPHWYIWGQQGQVKGPARNSDVQKASVNGKYTNLLKVIKVPGDEATYGKFNDWGYWTGTAWAGYTNLPPGYWVYVYPNWYIWGRQGGGNVQPQPAAPARGELNISPIASVNGKYTKLLKVINVPADQATYGKFYDYGRYTGTSWAGYSNLPPGYWVYVYPNWYIWGDQK